MSANSIVNILVSQLFGATPSTLQQSGLIISQGGTTLSNGATQLITAQADLTNILGSGSAATNLQAMYTTFAANNKANVAVTVVEFGTSGVQATGSITLTGIPTAADTVTVDGTAVTFVTALTSGIQCLIGATAAATATNLLNVLATSTDANISLMTYSLVGSIITITSKAAGVAGNAYTLAKSSTAVSISGATLSGGSTTVAAGGIQALGAFLAANPSTYYAALCPDTWAADSTFPAFCSQYTGQTAQFYLFFHVIGACVFQGQISGTTLTVSSVTSGHLAIGSTITGATISANTQITGLLTGIGGIGTYTVNNTQTVSSEAMAVANTFSSYVGLKSCFYRVKAPLDATTTFPVADAFALVLGSAPSPTNKLAPWAFRFVYGSVPYPLQGSDAATYKTNYVNYTATGAQGGIPNSNMLQWGTAGDGNDFSYWYSVDWMQINLQIGLANAIINGSNSAINPLYYNQNGINRLQYAAQAVANQAVNAGMLLTTSTTPIVAAIPFLTYTAANPNDYALGKYNGLSLNAVIAAGFKQINFALQVSQFVSGS